MEGLFGDQLNQLDATFRANLLLALQVLFFLAIFRVLWIQWRTGRVVFAPTKKKGGGAPVRYLGVLFWGLCFLFVGTLAYQATWHLMGLRRAEFVRFMQLHDRRQFNPARQLQRGRILDRNGVVLAENQKTAERVQRHYPLGRRAAHVVGYVHPVYGLDGVEKALDGVLAGTRMDSLEDWEQLGMNILTQEKSPKGKDIQLTLHAGLQSTAYDLLGNRRGAVVLMGIRSGSLYVLCSRPAMDPNHLTAQTFLDSGREAPLLNRCLHGLYPPGSTFKIAMAAYALEHGFPDLIQCGRGFSTSNGVKPIRDHIYYDREQQGRTWGGYGKIDLATALAESSNVYFAQVGVRAGREGFAAIAERMAFNRPIRVLEGVSGRIQTATSSLPDLSPSDRFGLAQMGIGQGRLEVTPLQMALVTAAVANEGVAPRPRMLASQDPKSLGRFMASATANKLGVMLRKVVTDGTARKAAGLPWSLAGKTGTAESARGPSHSWFTGYFPVEVPQLVVCVVVENGGYGAAAALPICIEMIKAAAAQQLFQVPAGAQGG